MASPTEIRDFLEQLPRGAPITIRLRDGAEIEADLLSFDGERILLEDDQRAFTLDRLESVALRISSKGPE